MTDTQNQSRLVTVVGGLGILMVVAGLVVLTVQAVTPEPEVTAAGDVPRITLLAPQSGDTVRSPIPVHFSAGDRLALGGMGWASDDLHLHAYVDGAEVMPAAADIEAQPGGTFIWHLAATPGVRTLELGWAGMHHGALQEGASGQVRVVVR